MLLYFIRHIEYFYSIYMHRYLFAAVFKFFAKSDSL